MYRVGLGFDAHRFSKGRKLIIGGVEIPHEYGLLGHSDADVLLHAICDAMLGAVGERDIGFHFPDKDPKYEGISSKVLLKKVRKIVEGKGFTVENLDCTIIAQEPKISPFVDKMKETISGILEIDKSRISIKATTTEGMGFTGRKEGIAVIAVVLLKSAGVENGDGS